MLRSALGLKIRPLVHPLPPLDIHFAYKLFQQEIGAQDPIAELGDGGQWAIQVLHEQFASPEMPMEHRG